MRWISVVFVLMVLFSTLALAHPGPADRYGCHVDEYGYFHCHP